MKQYNKIMTSFVKAADKLERLSESNAGKAENLIYQVDQIEARIADLAAESSQAYLMAEKIREFMEV